MIKIIKELNIEVTKPNVFQAIVAKQYDMNTRFLKVTLMDCGTRIDVPATSSVVINAERKDGQANGFNGEINEDGTVTVPLHSWMLELEGTVICDISVINTETDDKKKLTTTSFTLLVEKAAYGGDDITTDPQHDVLLELIERVENIETGVADQTYSPTSENAQSGKAVAEAISGVSVQSDTWRKITDLTLEEDSAVDITKDLDGKAISLKAFKIQVTVPVFSETATAYQVVLWANTKDMCISSGGLKADKIGYAQFNAKNEGVWGCQSVSGNDIHPNFNVMSPPLGVRKIEIGSAPITRIRLYRDWQNALPIGTKIEIWGLDA